MSLENAQQKKSIEKNVNLGRGPILGKLNVRTALELEEKGCSPSFRKQGASRGKESQNWAWANFDFMDAQERTDAALEPCELNAALELENKKTQMPLKERGNKENRKHNAPNYAALEEHKHQTGNADASHLV